MAHPRSLLGLLVATAVVATAAAGARAQDGFDNPQEGSTPCIVLNRYVVEPVRGADGGTAYRGEAIIENLCGRAMEVSFCFFQSGGEDDPVQSCYGGPVRPWASATVEEREAESRIAGAEYRWRYLE